MPALYNSNKEIPEEMLLGNLLFFSLTDMQLTENDLISVIKNNNLSENYVRKISKADAFRRATSSIKNQNVSYTDANGNMYEGKINVDEVVNDGQLIKRIVGVRVLNDKQEEVFYKQIASVTFDRDTDQCHFTMDQNILNPYNSNDVNNYTQMMGKTVLTYYNWAVNHNSDTIKNTVNRIINSMHPIALMPTGMCKFIPKQYKDTLYGLQGMLSELSKFSTENKENTVEIIPIMDTNEQRNLVSTMYEQEIQDSLYDYSQELASIIKNKTKLSQRQANTYIERYKELTAKASDYQTLLNSYTQSIDSQIRTAIQYVNDNKED